MQVTITFDPTSQDDVQTALATIMAHVGDQTTNTKAAEATTRAATGPTPDAAAKKAEQEAEAEKKRKAAAAKKKKDEEAAAKKAEEEAAAKAEATDKDMKEEDEVDPLGDDEPASEGPKHTREEVRAKIKEYAALESKEAAINILKEVGGAASLTELSEDKFDAVFEACDAG